MRMTRAGRRFIRKDGRKANRRLTKYRNRAKDPDHVMMGKMFVTKRGKYGCYKYVNGRRVAFVTKRRTK